ncbi:hypothetical protein SAMN05216420_11323 [Nitrosospira sp. Nl5]|nr:hypothetical protein SAMN05216420_11323 [Nitrosospira sp. Nl5]
MSILRDTLYTQGWGDGGASLTEVKSCYLNSQQGAGASASHSDVFPPLVMAMKG